MKTKNIQEMLQNGEQVKAGSMVACKLIPEMELVGFIPIKEDDDYLDLGMTGTRVVANRLVVNRHDEKPTPLIGTTSPGTKSYPIYKAMAINQENRQVPLRLLRVIPVEGVSHYYNEYQVKGVVRPQLYKYTKFVEVTNNVETLPYYQLDPGEYTFFENCSETIKAVATCFEVLCRRINKVTGCITYELYNAEDLTPIVTKEKLWA